MPIVYACIVPPAVDPGAARTADAVERVGEELRAAEPELLLLVTAEGAQGRTKTGVAGQDPLAERLVRDARAAETPVELIARWDGGPGCAGALDADARALPIVVSRLSTNEHFAFGRAIAGALGEEPRRIAMVCCATVASASATAGGAFARHYRRAIEDWDVKWLTGLDPETRRLAGEACAAQTAVLMGALSASRIEPRLLSYEEPGLLVAAIDVLGARRKGR